MLHINSKLSLCHEAVHLTTVLHKITVSIQCIEPVFPSPQTLKESEVLHNPYFTLMQLLFNESTYFLSYFRSLNKDKSIGNTLGVRFFIRRSL